MQSANARVVVIGNHGSDAGEGLTLPEQLGEIPSTFNGYIWVDDIWTVGPALRPSRDFRTQAQMDAAEAGLKRRRDAGGVGTRQPSLRAKRSNPWIAASAFGSSQ